MTIAVIDASAAVRIFLPTSDTPAILATARSCRLISPWLILPEVANAFWKYVRTNHMAVEDAQKALASLPSLTNILMDDVSQRALVLAHRLNHPVYDCFYLALAQHMTAPLLTADRRLRKLADVAGIHSLPTESTAGEDTTS